MKKFLVYLFSLSIILCTNSNSEIFKSKNGYILNLPNKYEVMEREYLGSHMTIIYNKKKTLEKNQNKKLPLTSKDFRKSSKNFSR